MNPRVIQVASELWPLVSTGLVLLLAVLSSAHAILNKREAHSSIAWVGLIWLAPILGAAAYMLLGRNRIRRRAVRLRESGATQLHGLPSTRPLLDEAASLEALGGATLVELSRLVGSATSQGLCHGNAVAPLINGDAAYPAMLEAVAGARRSIALVTYIFERKGPGLRFVDALAAAVDRGVEVRLLVDDVGARYGFPPVTRVLRRRGVPVARFLPARRAAYFNLRNHRKLLVVDGQRAFTGGMNIRPGHVLADVPPHPVRDLHFEVQGPVVAQLARLFAEDWSFTTGEPLSGETWFPILSPVGSALARAVPDGPDEDIDKIRWTLLGAIACARSRIQVLTPYFLPDTALATALNVAALRGVRVEIVVPERGNLPLVQWAMWGNFRKVLGQGCRIFLNPGVFDHSKLMVVDRRWTFFGSPNWDPRSLRLNFELGVECYEAALGAAMSAYVEGRADGASEVTLEVLRARSLTARLRDGVARLFTPYL